MTKHNRTAFSSVDLLAVIVTITALAAMQFPALNSAREASRRNACINNSRQIAIAVHNYHDVYRRFPAVAQGAVHLRKLKSGAAEGESPAQFSWLSRILPYVELGNLYNSISATSNRFRKPAFDPEIRHQGVHPSQIPVGVYVCPSFTGKRIATATEYENLIAPEGKAAKVEGVALGNYIALPATHLELVGAKPRQANGILVPFQNLSMSSVTDGYSQTLLFAESKEQDYASWYDGGAVWAVATPSDEKQPTQDDQGRWRAARGAPSPLNYGPTEKLTDRVYLSDKTWANKGPRRWGPSSEHAGDAVVHAYGDAGIRFIDTDIDPTVYMALITRDGKEQLKDEILRALRPDLVPKPSP